MRGCLAQVSRNLTWALIEYENLVHAGNIASNKYSNLIAAEGEKFRLAADRWKINPWV